MASELGNHIQRDGLNRGTAVAAVRGHAVYVWIGDKRVDVDTHDGVDRVDKRHGVRTAFLSGHSRRDDIRDVGRKLHDHGDLSDLLDPFGYHAGVIRHLPHRGTHTAFGHAVRATEVELKTVAARILRPFGDLLPGLFFRLDH